jgi:hypothetical protein
MPEEKRAITKENAMTFRYITVFVALLCLVAAPALAAQGTSTPGSHNYTGALQAKYGQAGTKQAIKKACNIKLAAGGREVRFCGQCSSDSACGTGWKCCGPSDCRECKNVVTCP